MTERRRTHPSTATALVAVLAVGLAGCQRGCLATWFDEHGVGAGDPAARRPGSPGVGGAGPRGSRDPGAPAAAFDLGGTDCSDGLARCSGGSVQVSIAGHIPAHCTAPRELPGACACAWAPAGTCAAGCVKEGLEVEATREVALDQLCATPEATLRPPTPGEAAAVTICAEEGVSCIENVVRACTARGQPARLAGVCVIGCAGGVALEPGDVLTGDGAASILCRRAHAERR
ncbi:hypothetical protein BH11MYX4_BH11MYX4_14680 [soil metagenome]